MEELPDLLSRDVVRQVGDVGFEGRLGGEGRRLCMIRRLLRLPLLAAIIAQAASWGSWQRWRSCMGIFLVAQD